MKELANRLRGSCSSVLSLLVVVLIMNASNSYADHIDEHTEFLAVNHATSGEIIGDILAPVPGDGEPLNRVEYKLKLYKGKLAKNQADVYFVITDASNRDFAERFGAVYSGILGTSSLDAVEQASFRDNGQDGKWTFFSDPGRVSRKVGGQVRPPVGNDEYSPIKQITYDPDGPGGEPSTQVLVNASFIKWGDGPGQTLLIDKGGCDELIRRNPPSELFEGNGPAGCENDPVDNPLARYKGGQVTALDITERGGTVTMKLHKGTFRVDAGHHAYYMTFESSTAPAAGFMGVIHAPRLSNLDRGKEAVGTVTQFGNGIPTPDGGPNRFQHGMISYPAGDTFYTPMWHIRWIFWDIDQDGDGVGDGFVLDNECNRSFAELPDPSLCGNQQAPDITFDPFQLRTNSGDTVKGVAFSENDPILSDFRVLPDGTLPSLINMVRLIRNKELFLLTDSPGGLIFDDANAPHIVNCPSPVTVLPVGAELVPEECVVDADCQEGYSCVTSHGPGLCYNFDL